MCCSRYPQIYEASHKLLVSPEAVKVDRADFLAAAAAITPASHRYRECVVWDRW